MRRWFELWTERDWEAFGAIHDPDVTVIPPEGWPDGEVSMGRDAWTRQSMSKVKGSDTEVATEVFDVFTLRDGKVIRHEMFFDRVEALKAAGLAEDARIGPE